MTPRDLLDIVDDYLSNEAHPLEERRACWDVLAGVRGPDRKRDRRHGHTVVGVIRARAFPKTARALGKGRPGFRPTFDVKTTIREAAAALQDGGGHYQTHAWRALLTLARWGPA